MADIEIPVDATPVKEATRALDSLEAAFGKLVAKLVREKRQFEKAFDHTKESTAALTILTNQQGAAAAKLETEFAKNQRAAAKMFAEVTNGILNVDKVAATASGATFSALSAEVDKLSSKFDKAYLAEKTYNSALG